MNVGPKVAVLVISVPHCATDAVNLANYARYRGATVIALIDGPNSVQQAAKLTDAISDYMYGGQSLKAQRIAVGVQQEPARIGRKQK